MADRLQADVRPGGGVAVVLLHGQPGTAGDWQWVEPLLGDEYKVIVPDRPGYGRTGGAATGFAGNADALRDLLDDLGVATAVVVGHSWAGGVAMAFASRYPERTRGLVLAASVGPGEHLGWADRLLAQPVVGEVIAAASIGGIGRLLGWSRVQRLAGSRLHGRPADAVSALTRLTVGHGGVWRSFVTEQRALLHELGRIRPPAGMKTVVLHGARDRVVPLGVARSNAKAIPGARLQIIEAAGHLLPHDHPEAIVAAVAQTAR